MKIFAELKSMQELADAGFKFSESQRCVYIGSNRFPTYHFGMGLIHVLGQKLEVVSLEKPRWRNEMKIIVTDGMGNNLEVPAFLVKNRLKIPKSITLKLNGRSEEAQFQGMKFKFPCSWSTMDTNEAIKAANWILKVTK